MLNTGHHPATRVRSAPCSSSSFQCRLGHRLQQVSGCPANAVRIYLLSQLSSLRRLDASAWGFERAERPHSKLEFQRCAACTRRRTHAYLLPGHFVQETVELRLSQPACLVLTVCTCTSGTRPGGWGKDLSNYRYVRTPAQLSCGRGTKMSVFL